MPLHMLPDPLLLSQLARHYSSDSRNSNDDPKKSSPGFASTLGFQSLSSLFQSPIPGRYSSPRPSGTPSHVKETSDSPREAVKPASKAEGGFFGSAGAASKPAALDSSPTSAKLEKQQSSPAPAVEAQTLPYSPLEASPAKEGEVREHPGPPLVRSFVSTYGYSTQGHKGRALRKGVVRRLTPKTPYPFRAIRPTASEMSSVELDKTARDSRNENAWEVSKDDIDGISPLADPPSTPRKSGTERPSQLATTASKLSDINKTQGLRANDSIAEKRLTHVTSTGEAHMVDVGTKQPSKRVAIAFAYVRFASPEPFRLIMDNSNKKGDVLGTARIAGIMAAKRTSELIPLCHPLAISKAELDVALEPPNTKCSLWEKNLAGLVVIQAQVECVGPTGVEMEALTAVTVAALTVYDMCKAVDRAMEICQASVVYKSGGASGLYTLPYWAGWVGRSFFVDRGLAIPQLKRLSSDASGAGKLKREGP